MSTLSVSSSPSQPQVYTGASNWSAPKASAAAPKSAPPKSASPQGVGGMVDLIG